MKIIQEQKSPSYIFSLNGLYNHLSEIYGDNAGTDFDKFCVQKYEINFDKGEPTSVEVVYNKVKVTHSKDVSAYWPIQPHKVEMGVQAARKLIEAL